MKNCRNCDYSNEIQEGYKCTRKILEDGLSPILTKQAGEKECPVHSDNYMIAETRYERSNKLRIDAKDVCAFCGRQVLIDPSNNFKKVKFENEETGEVAEVHICKICFDNLGDDKGEVDKT